MFEPVAPLRRRASARVTLILPAPVRDALVERAARNLRRPRDEAVAMLTDKLRRSGDLSADEPKR